jgi:hypothetical protein
MAPPRRGPLGVNLRILEAMDDAIDRLFNEGVANSELERRLGAIATSMSKIRPQAELEARVEELESLVKALEAARDDA